MEPGPREPLDGRRIATDPNLRATATALVRRSVEILDPAEADLVQDLIDPLVDRALRGERIDPGARDVPGGFGGADLLVWAVVPIVVHAVGRLLSTFGNDWIRELRARRAETGLPSNGPPFTITLEEAAVVVKVAGFRGHGHRLPQLVSAVQEAIYRTVAARRTAPYRDFAIEVGWDSDRTMWSRVLPSSGGSARSLLQLPFGVTELPRVLEVLEYQIRGPNRHAVPVETSTGMWGAQRLGTGLFESLFSGGLRDAYERSLATARDRRENLRLRLVLDPMQLSVAALPWEVLFDRRTASFLSHDPRTPLVRSLALDEPSDPRLEPARLPLRVLVVAAQPGGTADLSWKRESMLVEEALRKRQGIELELVRNPTAAEIRSAVRRFSPHILHFIGHGTFSGVSGSSAVLLTGPGETAEGLSGAALSTLLLGSDDLRLVVLNACDTAALPRCDGLDPFSAVATALIRGRLPAVVAMQFPITDGAAVLLSGAFYDSLAAGDPLEAAMVEARHAILDRDRRNGSCEWATPVLYLQVQDGDLFRLAAWD